MKQEYINKIREACIRANPKIARCTDRSCKGIPCRNVEHHREIQLADVLFAVKIKDIEDNKDRNIKYPKFYNLIQLFIRHEAGNDLSNNGLWDLTKPLSDQNEETLKFISEIVC